MSLIYLDDFLKYYHEKLSIEILSICFYVEPVEVKQYIISENIGERLFNGIAM